MYPKINIKTNNSSISLIFDFREAVDSVVTLEMEESILNISINSDGSEEYFLDSGFALFGKDNSSGFIKDQLLMPHRFSPSIRSAITKFSYLQTAILKVCIENPRSIQMLESSPCLLWLILDLFSDVSEKISHVHLWLDVKRKNIIESIFGSYIEGSEKFISKIKLLNAEKNEIDLIKRFILNGNSISEYTHYEEIPIQLLYLTERYPDMHGAEFLFSWCEKEGQRMSCYLPGTIALNRTTKDTIKLGIELNVKNAKKIVLACKTVDQLHKLHDKWVDSLNKSRIYYAPDIQFMPPTIVACTGMKWIPSANALIDEGAEMEHCIATYVSKVQQGKSSIFSIMHPERATLEISKRNNLYTLVELKGKRNAEVSKETKNIINDWLAKENKKLRL